VVGLPRSLVMDPLPRNDRELYERLADADPQAAQAMVQLGSIALGRGDLERARDFFARASESTPWFADPYYLIAETYRSEETCDGAIPRWWQVINCPIALSTRTANYDLGADHEDAEIYEAAATHLSDNRDRLPVELRGSLLGTLILHGDPFDARDRLTMAADMARAGDALGSERELLNALALATEDADTAGAYEGLISLYRGMGRTREADQCLRDRSR